MTRFNEIPGVEDLMGKGVYCGMPAIAPTAVRDRHAVVVDERGRLAACAAAAQELGGAGWTVTIVTPQRRWNRDVATRCRRKVATELVCATGIEYLEVLVLRRIDTGRIEACNASALFLLSPPAS
jgi:hypothetical protein